MATDVIIKDSAVYLTYSISDSGGELVERSDLPVGYIHGRNDRLHAKIEQALDGHMQGDSLVVDLEPSEGFGEHDPSLTYTDSIDKVPEHFHQIGAQVEMTNDNGESRTFIVSKIENGKLTVDGNHPFAGKAVSFNVEVVAVRSATEEELERGEAAPMGAPVSGLQ